jgi:hypothetical protein
VQTFTETMTDVRKVIREEVDAERRAKLQSNLDKIDADFQAMRETVTSLRIVAASTLTADAVRKIAEDGCRVLAERVKGLDYLVKGLLFAVVLEVIGGVTVAWIVHGMRP